MLCLRLKTSSQGFTRGGMALEAITKGKSSLKQTNSLIRSSLVPRAMGPASKNVMGEIAFPIGSQAAFFLHSSCFKAFKTLKDLGAVRVRSHAVRHFM